MKINIERLLQYALGEYRSIEHVEPISGGDISDAALVETPHDRFFIKWHHSGPADLFEREAQALRLMRATDTELIIPEPLGVVRADDDLPAALVLEYLEPGRRGADFDEQLGRGLAQLHSASADAYGFAHDNYCGTTLQPNDWTHDWIAFYGQQRLHHQVTLCDERRGLDTRQRRLLLRLVDGLDQWLDTHEHRPALIHGDLWAGNVHTTVDGQPAIFDPAAYYGHREAEMGMMKLFGGFSETVYDAYEEIDPLPQHWRTRVPLYSLYHVLNHYYIFGGHYAEQAASIAERWVT